ncbi:hypothetical protein SUDANB126_07082 [Streptomyces sp. enrichment culture]
MPVALARPVAATAAERERLKKMAYGHKTPYRLRRRAEIVLHAARGRSNARIARETDQHLDTVRAWRDRFTHGGLAALAGRKRTGRPAGFTLMQAAEAKVPACQLPAEIGTPLSCWSCPPPPDLSGTGPRALRLPDAPWPVSGGGPTGRPHAAEARKNRAFLPRRTARPCALTGTAGTGSKQPPSRSRTACSAGAGILCQDQQAAPAGRLRNRVPQLQQQTGHRRLHDRAHAVARATGPLRSQRAEPVGSRPPDQHPAGSLAHPQPRRVAVRLTGQMESRLAQDMPHPHHELGTPIRHPTRQPSTGPVIPPDASRLATPHQPLQRCHQHSRLAARPGSQPARGLGPLTSPGEPWPGRAPARPGRRAAPAALHAPYRRRRPGQGLPWARLQQIAQALVQPDPEPAGA